MSNDDTKACPVCGETIKAAAIKCRFCNTDLVAMAQAREAEIERQIFDGHPAVVYTFWQWVIVAVTLGLAWPVLWLKSRALRFEITSQRVRFERGLLSKTKDNVELFRIDDFDVYKPLGMRVLGHCRIHLRSSDPSFPSAYLYAIPDLEKLADVLRDCSLRERLRRKVTTLLEA